MNKRGKIIVSIVAIFIVLLALIGITYGYFLTRVTGNTEENSILITTANLELVYGDGNGIITASNIYPTLEEDDYAVTKTFTVSNNGNSYTTYGVYLENVVNTFEDTKDVMLTISCSSAITDEEGNETTGECGGFKGYSGIYPTDNVELFRMGIEVSEVHTYTLKVRYADDGTDQSNDMGKTLSGKIQIYDPNDVFSIEGSVVSATISEGTIQDGTVGQIDETKYYVEVQSDPLTSQISSNGSYSVNGLKPGTHTVYVKAKSDNSVVASKTLTVKKGVTAGIDDAGVITVNEEDSKVIVDLTVDTINKSMVSDASSVEFKYEESPIEWFTFDSSTQTATFNFEALTSDIGTLVIPTEIDGVDVKSVSVLNYGTSGKNLISSTVIVPSGIENVFLSDVPRVYLSDTVKDLEIGSLNTYSVELSSNNPYLELIDGSLYTIDGELMVFVGGEEYTLPETTTKILDNSHGNLYYLKTLNIPENVAQNLIIEENAFENVTNLVVNIYTSKVNSTIADQIGGAWYGGTNITVNWISD